MVNVYDNAGSNDKVSAELNKAKTPMQDAEWAQTEAEPEDIREPIPPTPAPDPDASVPKTLHNTTAAEAKQNVPDIQIVGDGDAFKVICKASSESEGWMKSTKAMYVGHGCLVQVSTQQRGIDGTYAVAEALTYVPGVKLKKDSGSYILTKA